MAECRLCGRKFISNEPFYEAEYCPGCEEGVSDFYGDYSELWPDETEEEFWEHEDW